MHAKQSEFYTRISDLKDSFNFQDKKPQDLDHNVLQECSLLKQENAKSAFELNTIALSIKRVSSEIVSYKLTNLSV